MNVWTFSGRCAADAELRKTKNGESVLSFRVANDVGWGDRKITQWVDVSVWGRRAESLEKYIKRGDKVTVSGELKLESFQRKDGSEGSKLSVRANEVDLAGRQDSEGSERNAGGRSQGGGGGRDYGDRDSRGGAGGRGGDKSAVDDELMDEIPF